MKHSKPRYDYGFITYRLIVLIGFAIDFLVYSSLIFFGHSVLFANLIGFSVGAVLNVILIRQLVFAPKFSLSKDVLLTLTLNGGLFLTSTFVLVWLVDSLGFNPYGTKLFVNAATFIINFIVRVLIF